MVEEAAATVKGRASGTPAPMPLVGGRCAHVKLSPRHPWSKTAPKISAAFVAPNMFALFTGLFDAKDYVNGTGPRCRSRRRSTGQEKTEV